MIADVHLGTPRARARELADYLAAISPQTLVIAGDLIELAALPRGLPEEHLAVIRQLFDLAHDGTRVYVLTGNHDAALGRFGDLALGNLHVRRELELHLDGHRYFFCHGDRLESAVRLGLAPTRLDAPAERAIAWADRQWNRLLRASGRRARSLARELRGGSAEAAELLSRYRLAAGRLAAERGCDTVVCAHVQRPEMADLAIGAAGERVRYLNPGDWVSHMTALEYRWGEWRLRRYDADDSPPRNARLRAPAPTHQRRATRSLLEQIVAGGPTYRSHE